MKLRRGRLHPHNRVWLALVLLVGGLVMTSSWISAQESEPTAVDLISFTITQQFGSDDLLIRWETAEEIGTAGYRLERDDAPITIEYEAPPNGDRTPVTIVPALGLTANGSGGVYIAYDSGPFTAGTTYEYTLVEIETDNTEIEIDFVDITIGSGPTATPENSSVGGDATATPLPTNTPRATNTPVPTTASNAQNTPTPTAPANSSNPTVTPAASQPTATQNAVPPTNSSSPDPTRVTQPTQEAVAAVGVVEAAENPQQDDPYPEPQPEGEVESGPVTGEETYPAGTPETEPRFQTTDGEGNPVEQTDGAYTPPDGASAIGTGSNGIGEESAALPEEAARDTQPEGDSQTSLVWGAFIAALLIFGASVIGAIMLFSRRSQPAPPNAG